MDLIERANQLTEKTHELLLVSDLTYREIAEGAGVGYEWLNKFSQRHIKQPGLDKIQPLHDFLASTHGDPSVPSGRRKLSKSSNCVKVSRDITPPATRVRKTLRAKVGVSRSANSGAG